MASPADGTISLRRRCGLWLAAWLVALACTMPSPKALPLVWVFPFGLLHVAGWKLEHLTVDMPVGWLPYVALTIAAAFARRRTAFYIAFVVLCLLLICNVAGCHAMLREVKDPH